MAKNIVICCDGTNNEIAGNQTNVLRLFRILTIDSQQQHGFYDAGVGTHADPTAQWPWRRLIQKRLDAAIGMSIRGHVLDAYCFLANHYQDGDRIFLFGFSRGAYTVRALAGMIYRCGLLWPDFSNLCPYAWSVFSDEDQSGDREVMFGGAARIKKVFGRPIDIHFVGVWDTVSTFGWIWDLLTVPNTDKNPIINHFRQALSLDERRSCFQPILFNPQTGQDSVQIWFAGMHADVGGGYPAGAGGLSKISLEWMLNEAVQRGLLIDLKKAVDQLAKIGSAAVPAALAPQHDESTKLGWRLQSLFPKRSFSIAERTYEWRWPNLATCRRIPDGSLVHCSTKLRMNDPSANYRPTFPKIHSFSPTIPCQSLVNLISDYRC